MKLTVEKARELLEEARIKASDDPWIKHSICVGNSAGKIAEKLNLDIDYKTRYNNLPIHNRKDIDIDSYDIMKLTSKENIDKIKDTEYLGISK